MNIIQTFKQASKKEKIIFGVGFAILALITIFMIVNFPMASTSVKDILTDMIDKVIAPIFVAVGVILAVFSIGQLVLAFKNEDADSKSRASTMLVVGVALIGVPAMIDALKLTDLITI